MLLLYVGLLGLLYKINKIKSRYNCTPHPSETAHRVWIGMKQLAILMIFHWISNRVRIFGNEEADQLDNFATTLETIQTCK